MPQQTPMIFNTMLGPVARSLATVRCPFCGTLVNPANTRSATDQLIRICHHCRNRIMVNNYGL